MFPWNRTTLALYFVLVVLDYNSLFVLAGCGQVFEGESGSFTVTTPLNTYNVDSCIIRVNVTDGKLAMVRFKALTLERDSICSRDYVEVRDGFDVDSELIRRYCEIQTFTVAATTNLLFLRVANSGGEADVYFSAEYFAFDPNDMIRNVSAGYISSPRFQGPSSLVYANNFHCMIKISVPGDFGIILTFSEFELEEEQSGKCLDYIEISDSDGHPLGQYCGRTIPRDLISHTNTVYIKFVTNTLLTFGGFYLTWTTCGGLYNGRTGSIASPIKNGRYLNNMNCDYIIRLPAGFGIVVTFTYFNMEDRYSDHCVDYVQLLDTGYGRMDPILQRCGQQAVPFSVSSNTNEMILRFVTDAKGLGYGFRADYEAVEECDYVFNTVSGTIASPVYTGNKYANNEHCKFFVDSIPGSNVLLGFEKFRTEEKYDNDCVDFIEIIDASTPFGSHNHYCGSALPTRRKLTGSKLMMNFISDDTVDNEGFVAHWAACGGTLEHHHGELTSPSKYREIGWTEECTYSLKSPGANLYFVQISSTGTKPTGCRDSLQISEESGGVNRSRVNLPCTDDANQFILSRSSSLFIKFNMALAKDQSMLFSLRWTACGSRITAPMGHIQSPGWPGYYPVSSSCSYLIDSTSGSFINLDFSTVSLASLDSCQDYVQVFDGENEYSPLLRKITGGVMPPTIVSRSNKMFVKFVQTCNQSSKGFDAKFTVCGVTFTEERGEITSPNYPRNYNRGLTCNYKVHLEDDMFVRLMFINFHVGSESNGECLNDYVEIRDGLTTQSPLIGKYCGQLDNFTISSMTNTAMVTLVPSADTTINFPGFTLSYKAISSDLRITEATTQLQQNFTIIYDGLTDDQQSLLDSSVPVMVTLGIIVAILIIIILAMVLYSRSQKPPLIIPEQKIVVKPNRDGVLNYRDNTHLIDVYNRVGEPTTAGSASLQQQIREQTQRRRSTGSHLQRDVYAHPVKRNGSSSVKEDEEVYFEKSDRNYDHLSQPRLDCGLPTDQEYSLDDPADNYAKVDKSGKQKDQPMKTFPQKRGFANDTYEHNEKTTVKKPQDMMYL